MRLWTLWNMWKTTNEKIGQDGLPWDSSFLFPQQPVQSDNGLTLIHSQSPVMQLAMHVYFPLVFTLFHRRFVYKCIIIILEF